MVHFFFFFKGEIGLVVVFSENETYYLFVIWIVSCPRPTSVCVYLLVSPFSFTTPAPTSLSDTPRRPPPRHPGYNARH